MSEKTRRGDGGEGFAVCLVHGRERTADVCVSWSGRLSSPRSVGYELCKVRVTLQGPVTRDKKD